MEITVNLPPSQWYQPSPDNDLSYWGLDYPPLSAYQSWLFGKTIQNMEPEAVALHSSRGYETPSSKVLMRWTAIVADLVCYLPAALACCLLSRNNGNIDGKRRKHKSITTTNKHSSSLSLVIAAAVMLFSPCLILIDHGHFQYNSIGLGAAAGAAIAITIGGWDHLGAVLYCVSLNHKQMNLYFAPAFFAFLLGKCIHNHNNNNNSSDGKSSTTPIYYKIGSIVRLGITVLATFAVLWSPFLLLDSSINSTTTTTSCGNSSAVLMVLRRIFPVQRGLYEDYVANFWCVSSLVIKWKRLIPSQTMMVKICAITTLVATLPLMVSQIAGGGGGGGGGGGRHLNTKRGLLLAMTNSALAFFLFSYQVHEKSILLALLPLNMLAVENISNNSSSDDDEMMMVEVSTWMTCIAAFSMFPLLKKDGLVIAYVAVVLCYIAIMNMVVSTITDHNTTSKNNISKSRLIMRWLQGVSVLGCVCIHVLEVVVVPPAKYPYLWDAVIMAWSGIHFGLLFVYLHWQQWVEFNL
jgi:alpha-1,3-glucosyltransferase